LPELLLLPELLKIARIDELRSIVNFGNQGNSGSLGRHPNLSVTVYHCLFLDQSTGKPQCPS
jgi:hypothetical protein